MLSKDFQDIEDLLKFVTEKQRSESEIQGFLNTLAHEKYHQDVWGKGTGKGHALRQRYKAWLKRKLNQRIYRLNHSK